VQALELVAKMGADWRVASAQDDQGKGKTEYNRAGKDGDGLAG